MGIHESGDLHFVQNIGDGLARDIEQVRVLVRHGRGRRFNRGCAGFRSGWLRLDREADARLAAAHAKQAAAAGVQYFHVHRIGGQAEFG